MEINFAELIAAGKELNSSSDKLNDVVKNIDAELKKFNLGLTVWVKYNDYCYIGYAKVDRKWGIAIRDVAPDGELIEWYFNDAPRNLRIEMIHLIPAVLNELTKEANKLSKSLLKKQEIVNELADLFKNGNK